MPDTPERKLRMAVAAFAVVSAAAMALLGATEAEARHSTGADSDGIVPVHRVCYGLEGNVVGRYSWTRYSNGYVEGAIHLDRCKMGAYGFGQNDRLAVLRHERAHSLGWSHYEGTPSTNAAYFPATTATGR